jgi:hypothetical protein
MMVTVSLIMRLDHSYDKKPIIDWRKFWSKVVAGTQNSGAHLSLSNSTKDN